MGRDNAYCSPSLILGDKDMTMYDKLRKASLPILSVLCLMLLFSNKVYADTDGSELQVAHPSLLEIQLGPEWAGVEFQLKTDDGIYPGVIVVDEYGILRTEMGNSEKYILSCLDSSVTLPLPAESTSHENNDTISNSDEINNMQVESGNIVSTETDRSEIPVKHIILFGIGILVSVVILVALQIVKKKSNEGEKTLYKEDDDDF